MRHADAAATFERHTMPQPSPDFHYYLPFSPPQRLPRRHFRDVFQTLPAPARKLPRLLAMPRAQMRQR